MPPQARRLIRLAVTWAAINESVPLYFFYTLLFADTGVSEARISALFIVWSAAGFAFEVPTGGLADRFGRRRCIVASAVLQGLTFALWVTLPGLAAFAGGFVVWGFGAALASGAFQALVYDGLAEQGARDRYAQVNGWVYSAVLVAQVPTAVAATLLFRAGGYGLVGWVSVAVCGAAALLATRLPEPPHSIPERPADGAAGGVEGASYLATVRAGLREAIRDPHVRRIVIAVAAITGLDSLEEYFSLIARGWGVPTTIVPLLVMALFLAGAAGAAFGGRAGRLPAPALGGLLGAGLLVLAGTAVLRAPAGLAGVATFYALHQMIQVALDARLQDSIRSRARATVTSVANLATEVVAIGLFALWALGGLLPVALVWLGAAALLPRWLRTRPEPAG